MWHIVHTIICLHLKRLLLNRSRQIKVIFSFLCIFRFILLTSSHRRPYKHKIVLGTADRRPSKGAFRFLWVLAGALSTRHAWRAIMAMNEFTLLWIFASSLYSRPVPLTYQPGIGKDGFISIVFDLSPVCRLFDRALVDNRPLRDLRQSLPTV